MPFIKKNALAALTFLAYAQGHAYPLPPQALESYVCVNCENLALETLKSSWQVHKKASPSTYKPRKSYSYSFQISAKDLQKGIPIFTTAAEALVVIKPLQKGKMPELTLMNAQNKRLSLQEASLNFDKVDANSVLPKQYAFQLKPELGHGNFFVQSAKKTTTPNNKYLIHVYDKHSSLSLEIQPSALHYQYGDTLQSTIIIHDEEHTYRAEDMITFLQQSNGQKTILPVTPKGRNQFEVQSTLTSKDNPQGENWALQVHLTYETTAGTINREARSAFSYAIPSAKMVTLNKISKKYLTFLAQLEVSTGSRYVIQGTLFKHNEHNEFEPIEMSQSAKWLEPGTHGINFNFDNSQQIPDDQLYIGDLVIIDYGQLKPVYQYPTLIKLSQLTG